MKPKMSFEESWSEMLTKFSHALINSNENQKTNNPMGEDRKRHHRPERHGRTTPANDRPRDGRKAN